MRPSQATVVEATVVTGGTSGRITVTLAEAANSTTNMPLTCDAVVTSKAGGYATGDRVGLLVDASGQVLIVVGVIQ